MSGSLFRNHDAAIGLATGVIFQERLRGRPGNDAAAEIKAAIVAGTPENRLGRLISNGAAFVSALRAKSEELLIGRLQNNHALPAHRDNHEFVLLELGGFLERQVGRAGWSRLRQRLEITNDGVGEVPEPAECSSA